MRPPIIVDNFGDVMFFESAHTAERYLEAIDVEHGEYVAYDSEGRLLQLTTSKDRVAASQVVRLNPRTPWRCARSWFRSFHRLASQTIGSRRPR